MGWLVLKIGEKWPFGVKLGVRFIKKEIQRTHLSSYYKGIKSIKLICFSPSIADKQRFVK